MPLEHVNITLPDAKAAAAVLCELFDWHIRWEGPAKEDGYSLHVGDKDSYLALYTPAWDLRDTPERYRYSAGLNHVGVIVDDIDATEARIKAAGFTPYSHDDYEPGRRFYFEGPGEIEYEVVQYD